MPDRLQLLRSLTGGSAPSALLAGEPAVNLADHRLFVGGGAAGGYPLGCQPLAYPKRVATPKIVGDVGGTALTTLALTAARLYFVPLVVPRPVALTGLRISVTTASAGAASIGIYGNAVVSGGDAPGALLASVTGLNTGTTGDKTGALSFTLEPGRLYWAALIASAAATLRALAVGSVHPALGRTANNTTAVTHLFAAGAGSTLPDPAPTALSNGTGACPAIYLME